MLTSLLCVSPAARPRDPPPSLQPDAQWRHGDRDATRPRRRHLRGRATHRWDHGAAPGLHPPVRLGSRLQVRGPDVRPRREEGTGAHDEDPTQVWVSFFLCFVPPLFPFYPPTILPPHLLHSHTSSDFCKQIKKERAFFVGTREERMRFGVGRRCERWRQGKGGGGRSGVERMRKWEERKRGGLGLWQAGCPLIWSTWCWVWPQARCRFTHFTADRKKESALQIRGEEWGRRGWGTFELNGPLTTQWTADWQTERCK